MAEQQVGGVHENAVRAKLAEYENRNKPETFVAAPEEKEISVMISLNGRFKDHSHAYEVMLGLENYANDLGLEVYSSSTYIPTGDPMEGADKW